MRGIEELQKKFSYQPRVPPYEIRNKILENKRNMISIFPINGQMEGP